MRPLDLVRLRRSGTVAESLRPYLAMAEAEAEALLDALGGPDNVSPQTRAIVDDVARVGLLLRALLARFAQSGGEGERDADLASKVGTLVSVRRSSLAAVGLARVARDVSLASYVAREYGGNAEDRAGEPNGSGPESSVVVDVRSSAPADDGDESGDRPDPTSPGTADSDSLPHVRVHGEGGDA